MEPIPLTRVCMVVGGKPLSPIPPALRIASVTTDSRAMEAGSLFVALRGETHDGHDYLAQAAVSGAIAAFVERIPDESVPGLLLIQVNNTRSAMGQLAQYARLRFKGTVIAVGGSNGKTGTKHLIDSALRPYKRGTFSPKSFNNDIGVPLAIFPADPHDDYLVLELGTNHHGEIRTLTNIALPDIAVITSISAEHLEGLGDLAGVRREEASIVEGLGEDGLLVVNGDDPALLTTLCLYRGRRITFGFSEANDLFAADVRCSLDGVRFRINGTRLVEEVFIPLLGRHTASNALAAIAVARHMGLADSDIFEALAHATGPDMRLQLQRTPGGITLLNDAYNANPASVRAAVETLCQIPADGRRVAIVGDMRELGDAADDLHREVGRFLAAQPLDLLICIGEKSKLIAEEAHSAGHPNTLHFPDTPTAARTIHDHVRETDLVLLKASRYMRLEKLAEVISNPPTLHRKAS